MFNITIRVETPGTRTGWDDVTFRSEKRPVVVGQNAAILITEGRGTHVYPLSRVYAMAYWEE